MKDFERIDELKDNMGQLEKAIYTEMRRLWAHSDKYWDDAPNKAYTLQTIAITLQHILEVYYNQPITNYGTKCILSDCNKPQIIGAESCYDHTPTEKLKDIRDKMKKAKIQKNE